MSLTSLREQLKVLIDSMFTEGLLDQQFQQLQMLQDESSPGFVAEVIMLFCEDSERILAELAKLLDQPVVDFQKVDACVHQLKGSSASVGAQNVKLVCMQFRQCCEENNKEGCLNALDMVRRQYFHLNNKFGTMLQLEQSIQAYESKQQN
ncbi:histidine-containing phosphotransfer protein 2 isoform X1 [Canna indica]|uniref:Histidine-containing phosphotransfer protein n=1 Tax=Canna indica TaxID=4628 RepID=A0AAQ3QBK4_9LILI|nr:histidine-containing phosphotransfer protein 2 isoform X1 [Canna indica]